MNSVIKEIFEGNTLSEKELGLISSKLKHTILKKGDFLLRASDEISDIYYVHSGCLRSYIIDLEGKEHILQFAVKGWWISDYIALYGKEKIAAVSYIECIKDASIYSISKLEFDKICREIPKVSIINKRKMELAFASFQNRILQNLTLTAKERYINFLSAYPSIADEVKNYHIASFLGITTESLSRIRKEIATK